MIDYALLALVICYNGQDVMYKGRDYMYVQYKTDVVLDHDTWGSPVEPIKYITRCDVGTWAGLHYQCSTCDIIESDNKGDKK